MKTFGLEKILIASSIWESFLSSSIRLFCILRLSPRIGSRTRSFVSCSWPVKRENKKLFKLKSKEIRPFSSALTMNTTAALDKGPGILLFKAQLDEDLRDLLQL